MKPTLDKKIAVLVAGMHRSGTSALAGCLAKLDVCPPRSLFPPSENNERGFWESPLVVSANNALLTEAGTAWWAWSRMPQEFFQSSTATGYVERLEQVITDQFGDAQRIVLKDPRLCRLLPLWQSALESLGYSTRIAITLRHPMEVALSLERKFGLSRGRSLLIWIRYMLDAELHSRGGRRSFLLYEKLLQDWRAAFVKLSDDLDLGPMPDTREAIDRVSEFISSDLRHFTADDHAGDDIHQLAVECYCAMVALTNDDAAGNTAAVEILRTRFEEATRLVAETTTHTEAALMRKQEEFIASRSEYKKLAQSKARIKQQVAERTAKLRLEQEKRQSLQKDLESVGARAEKLASDANLVRRKLKSRDHEIAKLKEEVAGLQAELAVWPGKLETEQQRAESRGLEIEELKNQFSEQARIYEATKSKLLNLRHQHNKQSQRLERKNEELQQIKNSLGWRLLGPIRILYRKLKQPGRESGGRPVGS